MKAEITVASINSRNNIIVLLVMATVINTAAVWAGWSSADTAVGKISYLDNGVIRLDVNLNLGGSVTYLPDINDRINIINKHDWGRQIQMSFYSGPVPFTPSGKQPSKTWTGLGWPKG